MRKTSPSRSHSFIRPLWSTFLILALFVQALGPGIFAVQEAFAVANKTSLCHRTGPGINDFNIISVSNNAVNAHLAHGDFVYAGNQPDNPLWCGEHAGGTLIINKVIEGYNGPVFAHEFSFKLNGGSSVNFEDTTPFHGQNIINVAPGTYTVTEDVVADFTATYNNCSNVTVAKGETKTCTITNTFKQTPAHMVTIEARKVVCDTAADLPKWGGGGFGAISATTAEDYVNGSNGKCRMASGWDFEWAPSHAGDPGNIIGAAGGLWTKFGPTNAHGLATTSINLDATPVGDRIWVREVMKSGFLGFSFFGGNTPPSAEMYCSTDALNYDNYDYIMSPQAGTTYHCVAFNVQTSQDPKIPVENTCILPDGDSFGKITEFGLSHGGEISLQTVLNNEYGTSTIDAITDETGKVAWNIPLGTNSVTVDVKLIKAISANNQAFGYYFDGDLSTFTPIFKNKVAHSASTTLLAEGSSVSSVVINTTGKNRIGFAIDTEGSNPAKYGTERIVNPSNEDHAVVYNPVSNKYVIGFEDLPFAPSGVSDKDYQDVVVELKVLSCSEAESCSADSGMISSNNVDTKVAKIELSSGSTTPNTSAVLVDPISNIQALGLNVWTATTSDSNAKWIWSENPVTNHEEDKYVTFTRDFTITGNPSEGKLEIAADNSYEVWVNGTTTNPAHFADANENNHSAIDTYNVLPYLVKGHNLITIRVKNWALPGSPAANNPGGLLYTLSWKSTCGDTPPPQDDELQVKIYKFLDGSQANASSSDSYNFPMHSAWNWPGNSGSGNYNLGPVGHGGSGPYQAFTSVMTWPADYQTYEITSDMDSNSEVLPIGEECVSGKYRLVGYTQGNTYAEALSASSTVTHPIFTNLSSDRYVIVWNETCPPPVPPPTAQITDVKLCKVDDLSAPLSNWTLALLGSKVDSVSVSSLGATTTSASLPGAPYVLVANGTYVYRNDPVASTSDAAFSYRLLSDPVTFGPYSPWARVNDFASPHTGWLGIMVNGAFSDWGNVFNKNHRYMLSTTTSATSTFAFSIWDDGYADNSGSLSVDIYRGYASTTDSTGCVTFKDVPYGDYSVDEVQQDGWTNISGLGSVSINSSFQNPITIVNSSSTDPVNPGCQVDCDTNNGGGGPTSTLEEETPSTHRTNGGGIRPFSFGAVSGVSDGEPEVLGAFDSLPGLPNAGKGPVSESTEALLAFSTLIASLLFANLIAIRSKRA
jgi:hypothetical protein